MKRHFHEISIDTTAPVEFIDITGQVEDALSKSKITEGLVTVFTRHTTTAIKINERCERLQSDMQNLLERIVPPSGWKHDHSTVDGRANAHSHLMSLLLNTSENIPVSGGKLLMGNWQSVFFVELDGPRKKRNVLVSIAGDL
jgi:secondary thiamine-phosphate synthase enzyme